MYITKEEVHILFKVLKDYEEKNYMTISDKLQTVINGLLLKLELLRNKK